MTAGSAPGEADELGRQARAAADAVLATLALAPQAICADVGTFGTASRLSER